MPLDYLKGLLRVNRVVVSEEGSGIPGAPKDHVPANRATVFRLCQWARFGDGGHERKVGIKSTCRMVVGPHFRLLEPFKPEFVVPSEAEQTRL
jgi:hypothetical protein